VALFQPGLWEFAYLTVEVFLGFTAALKTARGIVLTLIEKLPTNDRPLSQDTTDQVI
jgi:hypothetical protein